MTLFNVSQFAPFINASYGISVVFLFGIAILTFTRYRRATKRLAAAEAAR
jgi:heme exporter protein CcmD